MDALRCQNTCAYIILLVSVYMQPLVVDVVCWWKNLTEQSCRRHYIVRHYAYMHSGRTMVHCTRYNSTWYSTLCVANECLRLLAHSTRELNRFCVATLSRRNKEGAIY